MTMRRALAWGLVVGFVGCAPFAASDAQTGDRRGDAAGSIGADASLTQAMDGDTADSGAAAPPPPNPGVGTCAGADPNVVFCQDFEAPGLAGPRFGFSGTPVTDPKISMTLGPGVTGRGLHVDVQTPDRDKAAWLETNVPLNGDGVYDARFDMRITAGRRDYIVYATYYVWDGTTDKGQNYFFGLASRGQTNTNLDDSTTLDATAVAVTGGWQHVDMALRRSGNTLASTLSVDGTVVSTRAYSFSGVNGSGIQTILFRIGGFFTSGDPGDQAVQVDYDNVVIAKN